MLGKLRKAWPFALIAAACIWLVFVASSSSSFQKCIADKHNEQTSKQSEEGPAELLRLIVGVARIETDCGFVFLYDNRDATAAVATVFIAIFTFTLWRSTDRLWQAGEKQLDHARSEAGRARFNRIAEEARLNEQINIARQSADAADQQAKIATAAFTNLERPYIFIFGASKFEVDPNDPGLTVFVRYRVANHGKTPAIIENVRAIIDANSAGAPSTPLRVDEDHELFRISIIPSDHIYNLQQYDWSETDYYCHKTLARPQNLGQNELFLWIIINYRGAFTSGHETSTCWRYDGETDSLVRYGHDDYNYVR